MLPISGYYIPEFIGANEFATTERFVFRTRLTRCLQCKEFLFQQTTRRGVPPLIIALGAVNNSVSEKSEVCLLVIRTKHKGTRIWNDQGKTLCLRSTYNNTRRIVGADFKRFHNLA